MQNDSGINKKIFLKKAQTLDEYFNHVEREKEKKKDSQDKNLTRKQKDTKKKVRKTNIALEGHLIKKLGMDEEEVKKDEAEIKKDDFMKKMKFEDD